MITIEQNDNIAILKLDNGDKNPIGLKLLLELGRAVSMFQADPAVRGLVLASTSKRFFSIGFDIPALYDLPRKDFEVFYKAFNEFLLDLYTFPKPTAAAVEGHATAGGFILTLACDHRIVADERILMGLNESILGVPVPYFSTLVLEHVAGKVKAREHMEEGEFFDPETAFEMGVADYVIPAEEVLPTAIATVRGVDPDILGTYGMIKNARTKKIETLVREALDARTDAFLDRWYAPAARKKLSEVMKKY